MQIDHCATAVRRTKTRLTFDGAGDFLADDRGGRNFHFGIREHAMGATLNRLSLSKIRPFSSTFLIFSDYVKPAIRPSAIMELPAIYIFTHDSIGAGTHTPDPGDEYPDYAQAFGGAIVKDQAGRTHL